MTNNKISLDEFKKTIDNEIQKLAPEPHEVKRLKYKIDVLEKIPPPQIAISFNGEIVGTLGNFSVVNGKAKAKKSFYINILLATALSKMTTLGGFKNHLPNDKNQVLYFDTEQGKHHVQKAVKRICTQIDDPNPTSLHTYYLRSLTPLERLEFIENEIYSNDNVGFVVIDGIKDLVTSINDEEQATNIASKLLKWTEERNIHIVTVLHQNKSDTNARGHIGTELINKAETVLEVAKAENDPKISIVTPQQCRNIEPDVFAFEINEVGLPIVAENFEIRTETKKNQFDVSELEDFKKYQLLNEVFSKGESFGYAELVRQIGFAYKNQFKNKLGENRVKSLITDCKNSGWLLQEKLKAPYTLGAYENDHETDGFIYNKDGGVEDFI